MDDKLALKRENQFSSNCPNRSVSITSVRKRSSNCPFRIKSAASGSDVFFDAEDDSENNTEVKNTSELDPHSSFVDGTYPYIIEYVLDDIMPPKLDDIIPLQLEDIIPPALEDLSQPCLSKDNLSEEDRNILEKEESYSEFTFVNPANLLPSEINKVQLEVMIRKSRRRWWKVFTRGIQATESNNE